MFLRLERVIHQWPPERVREGQQGEQVMRRAGTVQPIDTIESTTPTGDSPAGRFPFPCTALHALHTDDRHSTAVPTTTTGTGQGIKNFGGATS